MALIPHENEITEIRELLYRSNDDITTPFGTYPKGNLFRVIFHSPDKTYAQIEDASPEDGEFPFQAYVETRLLDEAPGAVAKVSVPLPVPVIPEPVFTPPPETIAVEDNTSPEASTATVEASDANADPVADDTTTAPKKRTRKVTNTAS